MIGKESPSRLIRVCRHGVSEGGLLFRKQLKESGKRGPKDLKETTFARAGGWRDGEHERERERSQSEGRRGRRGGVLSGGVESFRKMMKTSSKGMAKAWTKFWLRTRSH